MAKSLPFQRIADLLQSLQLEALQPTFDAEMIDLYALSLLNDDDLRALNVPLGPRKKILSQISQYRKSDLKRTIKVDAVPSLPHKFPQTLSPNSAMKPLEGLKLAVCGRMSMHQSKFTPWIESHGATIVSTVDKDTNFLIATKDELDSKTPNVKLANAYRHGIPIVAEDFLNAAIAKGSWRRVRYSQYALSKDGTLPPPRPTLPFPFPSAEVPLSGGIQTTSLLRCLAPVVQEIAVSFLPVEDVLSFSESSVDCCIVSRRGQIWRRLVCQRWGESCEFLDRSVKMDDPSIDWHRVYVINSAVEATGGSAQRTVLYPVLEVDSEGTLQASKICGTAYLEAEESWPKCGQCHQFMPLFVQLNLADLPPRIARRFGGKGLIQVFFCTEGDGNCSTYVPFNNASLVRYIPDPDPTRTSITLVKKEASVGPVQRISQFTPMVKNFPRRERRLIGAIPYDNLEPFQQFAPSDSRLILDSLHMEASRSCGKKKPSKRGDDDEEMEEPEEEEEDDDDEFEDEDEGNDDLPDVDVNGYADWVQSEEYPTCRTCGTLMTNIVFNMNGDHSIPFMLGDCGTGQLCQCRFHPSEVAFVWACG